MKRIVLAASVAMIAGSAYAADLAVKAPVYKAPVIVSTFSWTGFYVGVNGGYAAGDTEWTYLSNGADASHHTNGGFAGGTAGYNWQFPATNWVIGVEGDFDWADINGSTACPNTNYSCQSKLSDFATLRGRFGYAIDQFLVYGTGGAAWGRDNIQTTYLPGGAIPPSGTATNGATGTRTGWAAGGGVEYKVWGPLSAKAEYLHYDLGNATSTVDFGQVVGSREKGDMVRFGINWKLFP
jgi:outer membrane immunogenic protein